MAWLRSSGGGISLDPKYIYYGDKNIDMMGLYVTPVSGANYSITNTTYNDKKCYKLQMSNSESVNHTVLFTNGNNLDLTDYSSLIIEIPYARLSGYGGISCSYGTTISTAISTTDIIVWGDGGASGTSKSNVRVAINISNYSNGYFWFSLKTGGTAGWLDELYISSIYLVK